MKRGLQGKYQSSSTAGETVRSFIPVPLPPAPPLELASSLVNQLTDAMGALGRLEAVIPLVPDPGLFLYLFTRKEAVLSSQIEGTQSSLSDLLFFETEENDLGSKDVRDVSNYVNALEYGCQQIAEGYPLSLRLIRDIHRLLMEGERNRSKTPGEFRHSQNWIGGTRPGNAAFVPPPPQECLECMYALEVFLNEEKEIPILLKAGLIHVQFETIHPFLDGNGRLGRMLVTLLLCKRGVIAQPLLYLSYFMKKHRSLYYSQLNNVRETGDWEEWLSFFLEAVAVSAEEGYQAILKLNAMIKYHHKEILAKFQKSARSTILVHNFMLKNPIVSAKRLVKGTGLSMATVNSSLKRMIDLNIVEEVTRFKRNRYYRYHQYMDIIDNLEDEKEIL